MAERPNQTRVRQAIEAFNQGQPAGFMELLGDDVVWRVPGSAPGAGTYHGKAGVAEFIGHLRQASEAPLQIEPLHLLSGGDDLVVAVWKARAARKGWLYEGIAGYLFRFCDGKVIEATNLQQDQDEIDRFWAA